MALTFGSLFAGVGGFDLGFERAGMRCAWQVEIDPKCREVLARHWPDVERFEDVRECGSHNLPAVDLVCGGFPCQDISVAGRRAGLAGERSGLWFEFRRVVAELRPRWVVIENVPGLLSSNGGRDMGAVIGALAELRYGYAWTVLDSQFFGLAQRRRRVFIVGHSGDWTAPAKVLFEPESGAGDSAPRRQTGANLARALTGSAGNGKRLDPNGEDFVIAIDARNAAETGEVAHTLQAKRDGYSLNAQPAVALAIRGREGGAAAELGDDVSNALKGEGGNGSRAWIVFDTTQVASKDNDPQLQAGDPRHPPALVELGAYNWQSGGDVRHSFGKPQLQASQVPAVGVRRLTPKECTRLQGFPDDWTAGQSDTARYRMMGNAVSVPVTEWIGRRIVKVEEKTGG